VVVGESGFSENDILYFTTQQAAVVVVVVCAMNGDW
jgi:hypothetical protein